MAQAIVRTVLIGFAWLAASCAKYPEPLLIKDTLGISKSLSEILEKKYGLFVTTTSKASSTDDFINYSLLLIGNTGPHMDTRIAMLGMAKTQNFLFREVIFIDTGSEARCPTKNEPCETKKDTLISREYKELPRTWNTYSNNKVLNTIVERRLNSDDGVFLMIKSDSKKYSDGLKELIVE